jgi:hypothetical protein
VIVVLFPFQNGEIRFDQCHVRERRCQPTAKLVQPIERDADLVPCLIERHHVLVRVDDLLDVLIIVIPPDQVALFGFDFINLLFGLEVIKMGPIHI